MKSIVVVAILLFTAVIAHAPRARACDPHCDLKLVGFDKAGTALVRRECSGIELVKVDLATGKEKSTIDILLESDPDDEREKLRAKRWKEAELALTKEGFAIDSKYPKLSGDKLGVGDGLSLTTRDAANDEVREWGGVAVELVARKGKQSAVLVSRVSSVNDQSSWDGYYLSPDKRHVIVLEGSCVPEVHVFDVAKLVEKLKIKPSAPSPASPAK